jgi:hypothetical protein
MGRSKSEFDAAARVAPEKQSHHLPAVGFSVVHGGEHGLQNAWAQGPDATRAHRSESRWQMVEKKAAESTPGGIQEALWQCLGQCWIAAHIAT